MTRFVPIDYLPVSCLVLLLLLVTAPSPASPPKEEILTPDNWASMQSDTIAGQTVKSTLSDGMIQLIQEEGWSLRYRFRSTAQPDTKYRRATHRYANDVRFNPGERTVENYRAGTPFPDVSPEDDHAGAKALYNGFYGSNQHSVQNYVTHVLSVDLKEGLNRVYKTLTQQYFYNGWESSKPVRGKNDELAVLYGRGLAPPDIKGIALLSFRYQGGRFDDRWLYNPRFRKTRRLPTGSWNEPIVGSDLLYTDIPGVWPHPTWFKQWTLKKQITLLASLNNPGQVINRDASSPGERYRNVRLSSSPRGLPASDVLRFEPRPVNVVTGDPKQGHPYDRSVLYVDRELNLRYVREDYKEGKIVRVCLYSYRSMNGQREERKAWHPVSVSCVDLSKQSSTTLTIDSRNVSVNPGEADPGAFSLPTIKRGETPLEQP